jgi:hypothetical protein
MGQLLLFGRRTGRFDSGITAGTGTHRAANGYGQARGAASGVVGMARTITGGIVALGGSPAYAVT